MQNAFMMDFVSAENSCKSQLLAVASSISITTMATSERQRRKAERSFESPPPVPHRSPIPGVEEAAGAALTVEDVLLRVLS